MDKKIYKREVIGMVRDKLKDERIVVGGNGKGKRFSRKYHLLYARPIVEKVINTFLNVIGEILEEGDSVYIKGYFDIEPRHYAEKVSRNVYYNKEFILPEHYRVKITPRKRLKEACKRLSESVFGNQNKEGSDKIA